MALLFLKLLFSNILHTISFEIFYYLAINLCIFFNINYKHLSFLRNNVWKAFELNKQYNSGALTNWLNSKDVVTHVVTV